MPSISRRKEKHLTPAELAELSQKRLRGELSCAECRRLKLRCDKKTPCGSCVRRGCETICPNGILEAGVGTRFILADTDRLHKKIVGMSKRIRELEDGLAILQATISPERHPLLRDELLKVKFGAEVGDEDEGRKDGEEEGLKEEGSRGTGFPSTIIDANRTAKADVTDLDVLGALTLGEGGEIKYFGRSAGSETLILAGEEYLKNEEDDDSDEEIPIPPVPASLDSSLPSELYAIASTTNPNSAETIITLLSHLPAPTRALSLALSYLSHGSLFFRPIKREELLGEVLAGVYAFAADGSSSWKGEDFVKVFHAQSSALVPSPHLLSMIFFVFALGGYFDLNLGPGSGSHPHLPTAAEAEWSYMAEAELWFDLGRRALGAGRVSMSDLPSSPAQVGPTSPDELSGLFPPTTSATVRGEDAKGGLSPPSTPYDTIRALGSMSTCLSMFGRRYGRDSAWAVMSLAGKIAQGCGMHRDPARWHMDPQTIQRRRTLWWEVLTSDISHSLALGRPPSIMLSFVDCEFPDDEEAQVVNTPGVEKEGQGDTVGMGFWRMKYTFARDSFMSVITATLMAKTPSYATVMNLDRKVREMTLPAGFKPYVKLEEDGEEVYHNSHFSLRDFYASQHRTVTMLYLHRSYFAHALLTCPKNPLLSPFAPSVLAAYRAASVIIKAAVHLFDRCPKLAGRVWFLIYHVFSAAVTVGTVVRRSPNSTITPNALLDLGLAVDLFGKCANESHRTKVAYLVLKKLKEKAEKSYAEFQKNKAAAASPSDSMRLEAISPSTEPISSPDAAGDAEGTPTGNEQELEENEDELEIFGGQTKLLMRKDRKGKMAKRKGSSTLSLGSGDPSAASASGSTPGSMAESSPSPAVLSSAGNGNENRDVDSAMNASGSVSGGMVSIGLDEPWDINSMNMNQDMDLGNMDAYASGLDIPMDIPMDLGGVGLDAAMGFGAGTTGTATGGLAPDGFGMGGMDAIESEGSSQAGPSNAARGVRPISEVHPSLVEYLSGAETNMGGFTTGSHSQRSFGSWGSSTATGSLGSSSFAPYDIGPSLDSIDWSNIMLGPGTSQSPVASTSSTSASATSGNGSTRHGMPASSQSQTSRSSSAAKDAVDMEELYNRFIQYLAQKQSELPGSHLTALLQNSETNLHHSGPASVRGHDHFSGTLSPYSFLHSRFGGPSNWPYVDSTIGIPGPTATQNSWLKTNFFQTLQNQQPSSDNNAGGDYRRLWQSLGLAQNSGMSAAPINSRWSTNSGAQSETHDSMDLGWSNVMRGAGLMDEGGRSG